MTGQAAAGESPVVPFLRAGPPPDRTRWDGWQQWRATRESFIPARRLSLAEYQALSPRGRALHDLHRTATHVNLRLQETPMSRKVSDLMRGRLQNNAVKFTPGTRDGLMISGGGFQGKTETACHAAAEFEDLWRGIHRQIAPGPLPGTRDLFVPVAYCRLPVRATPKGLCKTILDVYGDPHPATLHDLVRSVRDAVRDHATTALLIDDITRLRLHRGDDQDTLDLIRELMDLNVTLVLIGVDIPGSGLLRGARADRSAGQWAFPSASHGDAAATQTDRRFDLVDLDPFDYSTPAGITAFLEHLAGIEDQLRLLRSSGGMLTAGDARVPVPPHPRHCRAAAAPDRRRLRPGDRHRRRTAHPRTAGRHRHPSGQPRRPRPRCRRGPRHPGGRRPAAAAQEETQAPQHGLR